MKPKKRLKRIEEPTEKARKAAKSRLTILTTKGLPHMTALVASLHHFHGRRADNEATASPA